MKIFITKYVNIFILALSILFIGAAYKAQDFQLDASSDTLILENDQDLKNFREVSLNKRFFINHSYKQNKNNK